MNHRMTALWTKNEKYVVLVFRVLAGCLFIFSGFSKLDRPIEYFEIVITMYRVVPDAVVPVVAHITPWMELIFGAWLVLGYGQTVSATVLACMTFGFQLLLAQTLIRHLRVDECGCFGGGSIHLTLYQSFCLDTALLVMLIVVATSHFRLASLDEALSRSPTSSAVSEG